MESGRTNRLGVEVGARADDTRTRAAELPERRRPRLPARPWRVGSALLGLQLFLLLGISAYEWRRYALTYDFSVYAQSWWLIATGHLDPVPSVLGHPFLANNFELVLWPLALVHVAFRSTFALLVVQDVALVGANLLALRWALDVLAEGQRAKGAQARRGSGLAPWLVVSVVFLDPWCYVTALFDFHAEALAAPFVLLSARSLEYRRWRPALGWGIAAAVCGVVGALAAVGLGLGAVVSRRATRAGGAALAALGAAWVAAVGSLHLGGAAGADLPVFYGYLLPSRVAHPGVGVVLLGAIEHPEALLRVVAARVSTLVVFLAPAGLAGVLDPLAALALLAVAGPAMASEAPATFRLVSAFQVWPVVPLVLVASVGVLARREWGKPGTATRSLVVWAGLSAAVVAGVAVDLAPYWIRVSAAQASVLGTIRRALSPHVELVASQGFVGRFSSRSLLYTPEQPQEDVPIVAPTVVFVLSTRAGLYAFPPGDTAAFVYNLEHGALGARLVRSVDGIEELVWHPPPGVGCLAFPSARVLGACSAVQ